MNSLDLFPIVWKDHYDFDWENIKEKVYSLIDESDTHSSLESGGITTVGLNLYPEKRPHLWEEFSGYLNWLQLKVEGIWQKWGLIPQSKLITGSWFNLHQTGNYTKEHHHHSTHVVATAYLRCPKNSGCIQFQNPFSLQKLSEPVATPDEGLWVDCVCETNDILLFPGWLQHRTQPSQSNEDRIVFTVNISGVYD